MMPWKDLETSSRFGTDKYSCIKGNYHSVWGLNLYQIDVPTFVSAVSYMTAMFAKYPAFRESFLAMDMVSPRVTESIPDNSTAYPYRNAIARL